MGRIVANEFKNGGFLKDLKTGAVYDLNTTIIMKGCLTGTTEDIGYCYEEIDDELYLYEVERHNVSDIPTFTCYYIAKYTKNSGEYELYSRESRL